MNKRIAIFGASGYLGRHLLKVLTEGGDCACVAYDVAPTDDRLPCEYHSCDVTMSEFWKSFKPEDYDVIIFLSGLSGPERSFTEADKFVRINQLGLLGLLDKLAPLGRKAPRIVFPSSRLVYAGGGMVTEESPVFARSIYAATKIACEQMLSAYHARYDLPYVVLRICVPYGNLFGEYSYGTIGFFVKQAIAGKPITVYGDGSCRKTYTHINDLCGIFKRVIAADCPGGVYNVGGHDYTLSEVAKMVAEKFKGKVEHIPWPDAAERVEMGDISLSVRKLQGAVGRIEYLRLENHIAIL